MQKILEHWGGPEFVSFLNCVRESWGETHEGDEAFPNTMAMLLSSHRLTSAVEAGWGQWGCMLAAASGNIGIFTKWKDKFGCTVKGGLVEAAVRGNNTAILEVVLEQYEAEVRRTSELWPPDFAQDKEAYNLAVASGNAEMVAIVAGTVGHNDDGVTADGLEQAAKVGNLDMAKILWESFGYQDSKYAVGGMSVAIEVAASHGHFEVMEWCVRALHRVVDLASRNVEEVMRHVSVLRPLVQWLHEDGCFSRWGDLFPLMGAERGNLEWVLWCLENGWEYEHGIMELAARGGHLRVVRGLRERGYRWTTQICGFAAKSGQVELLKWCLLNGCPWSWQKVLEGGQSSRAPTKIRAWCVDVGGGEVLVDGAWVPMVAIG